MSAPERRWPPAWAEALAAGDVDREALYLALEAASWPRALPAAERRAFALLVLASCEARAEGATRLALQGDAGRGMDARLQRLGAAETDRTAVVDLIGRLADHPQLEPLVGRLGDRRPFIVDGGCLYQERDLRLEEHLADELAARIARPLLPLADPAAALAAAAPRRWTTAQNAAITAALTRPLTVVTGGPGSGKTALIGGIVRAWRAAGMPADAIAVAAPTGKAANRIAEGLVADGLESPVPSTLHRLLGFSARRSLQGSAFRHHENNRLPHAGVIVDEASMVDLMLVEQLARAVGPQTRLVLIGDADQLPAIQAGSVLRDLGPLAITLPESHRMSPDDPAGAEILGAARQIAAGQTPPARDRPAGSTGIEALTFVGFELCAPDGRDSHGRRLLGAFVDLWYARQVRPIAAMLQPRRALRLDRGALDEAGTALANALLDRHRRARLLTVTRVGQAGADRINDLLVRRAANEQGATGDADSLPPGTPVMMIENDYDRGLMNGDQGVALLVDNEGTQGAPIPMFAFPHQSALALFPAATLRGAVAVSYATTVHKAQGSELEEAALILPESDLPLLSRELVYTAVTRARRSIVVVGRRALLEQAASRPLERSSGLAPRLAARGAFGAIEAASAIDER